MDPVPPAQPSSPLPNPLLASGKGKIVILTVVIIILGALFYFLYYRPQLTDPNYSMSGQVNDSTGSEKYPTPNNFQSGPFYCPSVASFCESGQDVTLANSYIGFGGKVEAESPIYAAFDGEVTASLPPGAEDESKKYGITIWWSVLLVNKENAMKALYTFPGKITKQGAVKRGDVIGSSSGKMMPTYGDYSLIFRLNRFDDMAGSQLTGETVKLEKTNFSQNL